MTRLFAPFYLIGCNVNYVAEIQKSSISFGTQPHYALINSAYPYGAKSAAE
jgi:hypothetical protein